MGKTIENKFRCLNCGKAGIPLRREKGHQHKDEHRKKMYCPFCGQTVNHIEIKTYEQDLEFINNFNKGLYKQEAEESINFTKGE
jgi:Zn finger protein HypA/HybF involved in hydrogenase expression